MLCSSRQPIERAGPEPVIARLTRLAPLTAPDIALLRRLDDWRHDPPDAQLIRQGQRTSPRFLVSGWAARIRLLADGRRQIIGFVLPGDGLGFCRRPQPMATCAVVALTPVQTLDAGPVIEGLASPPDRATLARAIDIAAGMDEAWLMDQIVRLGRLTAYERLSHLILELRCRLAAVGHTDDADSLSFPPTQEDLGDATGLSMVHVNRTLRQLREDGMIGLRNGRLTIHNAPALAAISGFRPPRPSEWVDHPC